MITEETIYRVLDAWRNNPNIKAGDVSLSKEDFFDVLEIISDEGFAKDIRFSKGAHGKKLIAFYDNATITLKGIQFLDSHKQPSPIDIDDDRKCVFISYCWADNNIADNIENYLADKNIVVKRDIRNIGNWRSIREFMKTIRKQDYAVLIISDNYLKSENCMYEIVELLKDTDFANKIFPVVIEKSIYDTTKRIEYISYWESKSKELEAVMQTISMLNRGEATATLKKINNIAMNIGEFLEKVSDMNNPKIDNVAEAIWLYISNETK